MLKISIVLPTNRTSFGSLGRIISLYGLDPSKFELVISNNSNDIFKSEFLSGLKTSCVRYVNSICCDARENAENALNHATGDFVLFAGDDDRIFEQGLFRIYEEIFSTIDKLQHSNFGFTGTYLIESDDNSQIFRYGGLNNFSKQKQIETYVKNIGPNLLYYSIIPRKIAVSCFSFSKIIPSFFSFSDQIMSLFYLRSILFFESKQLFYGYSIGEWANVDNALKKDRNWYEKAGFDSGLDVLHYLLIGLEGFFILNSRIFGRNEEFFPEEANNWLIRHLQAFFEFDRSRGLDDRTSRHAILIKNRLSSQRNLTVFEMLSSATEVMAISNEILAQRYFNFWKNF